MTPRKDLPRDYVPIRGEDGTSLKIEGKGKLLLHISKECGGFDLDFTDVLHVPKLQDNLISQGTLDKKGMKITTVNGRTEISEKGKIFLVAHRGGTLYFITTEGGDTIDSLRQMYAEETRKASLVSTSTWHNRLGHLHETALDKIPPISDRETTKLREPCDICIQAKMKRLPFQRSHGKKPDHLLERIHYSDVVGPISARSLGESYYFVGFLDEYSNYVSAVPVRQKSDCCNPRRPPSPSYLKAVPLTK